MKILGNEETSILNEVQKGISDLAIIAGGAVRDRLHDTPYKDVDIFLPSDNPVTKRFGWGYVIDELLPAMFGEVEIQEKSMPGYNPETPEQVPLGMLIPKRRTLVSETFKVLDLKINGTKYQLIFTPKLKNLYSTFDFTCNMVSYDGNKFHKSKKFNEFFDSKMIKCAVPLTEALLKRVLQLRKKYPQWTVDPAIIAWAEAQTKKTEAWDKSMEILQKQRYQNMSGITQTITGPNNGLGNLGGGTSYYTWVKYPK